MFTFTLTVAANVILPTTPTLRVLPLAGVPLLGQSVQVAAATPLAIYPVASTASPPDISCSNTPNLCYTNYVFSTMGFGANVNSSNSVTVLNEAGLHI